MDDREDQTNSIAGDKHSTKDERDSNRGRGDSADTESSVRKSSLRGSTEQRSSIETAVSPRDGSGEGEAVQERKDEMGDNIDTHENGEEGPAVALKEVMTSNFSNDDVVPEYAEEIVVVNKTEVEEDEDKDLYFVEFSVRIETTLSKRKFLYRNDFLLYVKNIC